ncbi:MAG: helix-turn-helix transcriptional regulator [Gemmatimonadales bacterium]|nr:helix-turn-helix transcriptional regulator [Gemmatimonadales bacterium]
MPVVNRIGRGGARFSDLQLALAVSSSTLADTLQELETVGLVDRVVFPGRPPGSSYFLTAAGRALRRRFRPFLEAIRKTD